MSPATVALPRLMLVTDRRRAKGRDLARAVLDAVRGGVRCVQVREPELPDEEYVDLVRRIRDGATADTVVIVNRRWRIARVLRLPLHLPAGDARPKGPETFPLVGRSAHDEAEARVALEEGAHYIVGGTVYATDSKPGHPGDGLDALRRLVAAAAPVPVFAIGGITISRVPEVLRAGAHGVAVCGAILGSPDPQRAAEGFLLALAVAHGGREVVDDWGRGQG